MSERAPIVIAGGGIGGMAVALALARAGRQVELFERATQVRTSGAGIQLGPNAVKVLRHLGVADAVRARASEPVALAIHSGRAAAPIARMPLGAAIARRHGAPYWTIHRADLLQALADAARARTDVSLTFGREVVEAAVAGDGAGVRVRFREGGEATGAALIGADGVWSQLRWAVAPRRIDESGYCAYRSVLPVAQAGALDPAVVGVWMSPQAHVIHYPVSGGTALNLVVVVRDTWTANDWDAPADAQSVLSATEGLADPLRDVLQAAPQWHKWSLPRPIALETWCNGRITLLGDAAHAMLPFFAQGGVMALEDAAILAARVGAHGDDLAAAFASYHALRRDRVRRVQGASVQNGDIFHMSGALALARDAVLRVMPGTLMLSRYDWLYGYDGSTAGRAPQTAQNRQ